MSEPDHVSIANLVYRYGELIDAGDYDGIGELLAHAVITADGADVEWSGAEEITNMYTQSTRLYDDGTPRTKHVITNLLIEVDDDAAPGRAVPTTRCSSRPTRWRSSPSSPGATATSSSASTTCGVSPAAR